jgi:LmbE family N-acetylglucosaminyl deacetylase
LGIQSEANQGGNMASELKLMCILAHPDDETLGTGGILAKYAAEGIETYLVTATLGQYGWALDPALKPEPAEVGRIREGELRCAAQVLGVEEVFLLGYTDGEVSAADPKEVVAHLVTYLRQVRPQVVVTFDSFGVYGHPDHIAIAQLASAAVMEAANSEYSAPGDQPPFSVQKLYYTAEVEQNLRIMMDAMGGEIRMPVDGQERRVVPWPDWSVTTRIDIADHWEAVVAALACHKTQIRDTDVFAQFPKRYKREEWGMRTYYRAFSLVNGGREVETDLFAGLR